MNLQEFEATVKAIDFQKNNPNVSQNWENFQEHVNAFVASCQPAQSERLLKPKRYEAVFWKIHNDENELLLYTIPQRGIGTVIERYPIGENQ